ncbi:MAG: DUF4340 domain-containing protein [Candidatus Thiodiazotropha endolucinida]|nr:DUF4340 domain-containing protein [Candidatus Thiodiazotropha taylori]MCG8094829.1 DUF4340 domain-containing protein [Candidatus Thiodiazotropha endolucinida]MCG8059969.1 DUF4340 domain-containing protein [Candidatus Thiodiazotropha taylori]MCG8063143.1 DUF4340 domain-containing protein [Candidatus Thiodiazotropha taylori]MCW4329222.1 DUF4340 domain-containing protein [Candidatus Thiodiazotropha endolucinida]
MVSRTKINLLLLAAVGLLGLLVWLSQPAPLPPLTHLDPQQITRIRINDLQGREISLMRRQNQWMSGDQPADQSRVRQLLKICRTPSLSRFTAPDDLEPYGLAPSPIMMALDDTTLSFGNSDPVNGWRYVHHRGEVHLIADGFYHHLIAPPEAWLAKTTD